MSLQQHKIVFGPDQFMRKQFKNNNNTSLPWSKPIFEKGTCFPTHPSLLMPHYTSVHYLMNKICIYLTWPPKTFNRKYIPWSTSQQKFDFKLWEEVERGWSCVPLIRFSILLKGKWYPALRIIFGWFLMTFLFISRLLLFDTSYLARVSGSLIFMRLTTTRGPAFSRLLSLHTCGCQCLGLIGQDIETWWGPLSPST